MSPALRHHLVCREDALQRDVDRRAVRTGRDGDVDELVLRRPAGGGVGVERHDEVADDLVGPVDATDDEAQSGRIREEGLNGAADRPAVRCRGRQVGRDQRDQRDQHDKMPQKYRRAGQVKSIWPPAAFS